MLFVIYRYVYDRIYKKNETICRSSYRENVVTTSNGRSVDIVILRNSGEKEEDARFLIRYEGRDISHTFMSSLL